MQGAKDEWLASTVMVAVTYGTRASHSSGLCFDERLSSMKRAAPYLASGVWVNAGSRRLVADDHSGLGYRSGRSITTHCGDTTTRDMARFARARLGCYHQSYETAEYRSLAHI